MSKFVYGLVMLGIALAIGLVWLGGIGIIWGYGLLFIYRIHEITGIPTPIIPIILLFLGLILWFIFIIIHGFIKYKILKRD